MEHQDATIRPAIVCADRKGELLYVYRAYGVSLFEVTETGVKVHAPEGPTVSS